MAATSLKSSQKLVIPTNGPHSAVVSIAQLRDAVGYMKVRPEPARKVAVPGFVRMAGSVVEVKTEGVLDGNVIHNVSLAEPIVGADVAMEGLPDSVKVVDVTRAFAWSTADIHLSNVAPFAPSTGKPQPVIFRLMVNHSVIAGLSDTELLEGASVSGPGIPEGSEVLALGAPGEVFIKEPPVEEPIALPAPEVVEPADAAVPETSEPPPEPPPAPLASLDPVDVVFVIPTKPIHIEDGVSRLILTNREEIDSLVVTLPTNPVDGQQAFIFSSYPIHEFTLLAPVGQSINLLPEAQPTGIRVGYLYSESDATWDRIQ